MSRPGGADFTSLSKLGGSAVAVVGPAVLGLLLVLARSSVEDAVAALVGGCL